MAEERRVTREDAESLMRQVRAAASSGTPSTTVTLAGAELTVEAAPEGGYLMRAPGQSVGARVFLAPDARPAGYPADLPFVAGESGTFSDHHGSVTVMYWAPEDPAALVRALHDQTLAQGWSVVGRNEAAGLQATNRTYAKEGLQRHVLQSDVIVSVTQRPARGKGPA